MLAKNTLVLYKKQPAIITEIGEKYTIEYQTVPATATGKKAQYGTQKVRDKDIVELFSNCKVSLESIINQNTNSAVKETFAKSLLDAYELLLSDEETASTPLDFSSIVDYSIGELSDLNAFAFYDSLVNEFTLSKTSKLTFFLCARKQKSKKSKRKTTKKNMKLKSKRLL